jgi:hypothetical protein
VHFHPDRVDRSGQTVAEGLLQEGCYKNQFETGLSSGSWTAFPGGERDEWERRLFGGAYHRLGVEADERPKYGGLELVRFPDGPWPRFGSSYLVLRATVSERTTFTFSGSEQDTVLERLGTIDVLEAVFAALFDEIATGQGAAIPWPPFRAPTLEVAGLTIPSLMEQMTVELPRPRLAPSRGTLGRVLDTGLEAQVHGAISTREDIELIVADPSFQDTATGRTLEAIARGSAIDLHWHPGFRLAAKDVPGDFRGPIVPRLAQKIARDGVVDAAVIGAAEASLRLAPETWREWGTFEESLQHLKQLWHVLVHSGAPSVVRSPHE